MSFAFLGRAIGVAAFATATVATGLASAQEAEPPPAGAEPVPVAVLAPPLAESPRPREERDENRDPVRFRGGIAIEGGLFESTGTGGATLAIAGLQGQTGIQINSLIGLYAVPSIDLVFGDRTGLNFGGAILLDFTIVDRFAIGGGPDVGAYAALDQKQNAGSGSVGAVYGGRLHLAAYPAMSKEQGKRSGLEIGADMRFLTGYIDSGSLNASHGALGLLNGGVSGVSSRFLLVPMVTIGYAAF